MKNVTPKIEISSTLHIPEMFLDSIDQRRHELSSAKSLIPAKLETLEHNSSETYLSGIVELGMISEDGQQKDVWKIPALSRFLFTYSNETEMDPDWLVCLS